MGLPRHRRPAHDARREPRDGRRLGRVPARRTGKEVVFDAEHFFDGLRANRDYALAVLEAAAEAGADWVVLCDTNGGSQPDELAAAVADVVERDLTAVGIHVHNDGELAVANTLAAVAAGARQVQGTINGYGERVGNANLCSVIPNLVLKLGRTCTAAEHLDELAGLSASIDRIANLPSNPRLPFVGEAAFAHKGGIHVQAISIDPRTYEHVDPASVGNERRVLISELQRAQQRDRDGARARARARSRRAARPRARAEDQGARERGLPLRGRGGVVRAARPARERGLRAAVRGARIRGRVADPGRRLGHELARVGRGGRRRRDPARRGLRRRAARRARARAPQRPPAGLSGARARAHERFPRAGRAGAGPRARHRPRPLHRARSRDGRRGRPSAAPTTSCTRPGSRSPTASSTRSRRGPASTRASTSSGSSRR